ncbi:MAG TPA: hypothetical protein VF607_03160 [Verrucomicrobiae bacterium]
MNFKHTFLVAGLVPCLLVGCASQPVALAPVGPGTPMAASPFANGAGYLQVFSDTESHVIGDGTSYYPHTGYTINDVAGKRLQYVPNHVGNMDETPTPVRLPVGSYQIVAESSSYGRVTVPVVIRSSKTTTLHLDRSWRPAPSAAAGAIVRLPDGEAVGWSEDFAKATIH